jgi:hypothetical protein
VKHLEPRLRDSLAHTQRLLDTALARNGSFEKSARPFHFDYMGSDSPNAIAFQYEEHRFIIVTIPMAQLLLRTSELLSKSSSVVSLLGLPTLEPPQQEGLSTALFLFQLSFLTLHEFAHHILGHVGAGSSEGAFSIWTEALDKAKTTALERQAQELHADSLAVWYLLNHQFRAQDSVPGMLRLDRTISDDELLGLFLVAVTAFFESSPAAAANETDVYTLGHPPRDLRMASYVRDWIEGWCGENRPGLKVWLTDDCLQHYMIAAMFAVSGADAVKRRIEEMNFLRTPEGQKYFKRLERVRRRQSSAMRQDRSWLIGEADLAKSSGAIDDPEQPPPEDNALAEALVEQARSLRDRHAKAAENGQLEIATTALREMRELQERYPEDLVLPGALSSVLKHHCDALALAGQTDQAFAFVEEEARLLQRYPDDPTIPGTFASALGMAWYISQGAGRTRESARQLDRLMELGKEYPNDVLIRKLLAQIFHTWGRFLAGAGSLDELTALTATARSLYRQCPGDEHVREALVDAMLTYAQRLINSGGSKAQLPLIDELRQLHRQFPEDRKLLSGLVNSIGGYCYYLGGGGNLAESGERIKELAELQAEHPDDAELRETFAKALGNYCLQLESGGHTVKSGQTIASLRHLQREHPQETALLKVLAQALYNRSVLLRESGSLDAIREVSEELRRFHHLHPAEADIARWFAEALLDLFGVCHRAALFSEFSSITDELRLLCRKFPGDPTFRQLLARALISTAIVIVQDRSQLAGLSALINEVRDLYKQDHDPAIRELLAKVGLL